MYSIFVIKLLNIPIINIYISVTTDDFIIVSTTSEEPSDSCQLSEFGCCPDGVTGAAGYNLEGCLGIDFDNCTYGENNTGKLIIKIRIKYY
jgi:hypothetical protein